MWIEPDWPAPGNIRAVSTLRIGGTSEGDFSSFNLADHVGDDPVRVSENRDKLKYALALPEKVSWLKQTHSTKVVRADEVKPSIEADASYSYETGVVCVVMTADCLPILLCDSQGSCIASLHCGWRGLAHGIIEATISKMPRKDLMAWLGPAIGAQKFEVGKEVRDCFIRRSPLFSSAFQTLHKDKWLANIYELARLILSSQGVTQLYGGDLCTYSDTQHFYSYRREPTTGRMATLIWRSH